jgi:hypothetical protein
MTNDKQIKQISSEIFIPHMSSNHQLQRILCCAW